MAPDGTEGHSIEVFNALGETIAVTRSLSTKCKTRLSFEVRKTGSLGLTP